MGERVSGVIVVLRGQLRVYTLTPDGNEATLYMIRPGETCVLAMNCVFKELAYPAWVDAGPGTMVAIIAGPDYRTLFDREPSIRGMTFESFSSVVFTLMGELEAVHSFKLEQRLSRFLLTHRRPDGIVRMTQQEIASHLGTTREVIARLMRRLVRDKSVKTLRGAVVIANPSRLKPPSLPGAPERGR